MTRTFRVITVAAFLASAAALVFAIATALRPPVRPTPPAPLPVMGVCVDMLPYDVESGVTAVQSVSTPTVTATGVLVCEVGSFVPVRPS